MYTRKKCEKEDIWVIRDFLKETYKKFGGKVNWHIDRLNFTYSMSRHMNEVTEEAYREAITMYLKDDVLEAVLLTEGENRGEAFFEISSLDIDDELKHMMFNDADILGQKSEHDFVELRLHSHAKVLLDEAVKRGYEKVDWSEVTMKKILDNQEDEVLPEGYEFITHDNFEDKANAHAHAFGYHDKKDVVSRSIAGLKELRNMPDYNKSYDIAVAYKGNEVAFATMWYDSDNQIGILEPVGTHEDHRRLGLAKAAVYRGCNLIREQGARAVYVGSDQEFYKAIGFTPISTDYVYKKSMK